MRTRSQLFFLLALVLGLTTLAFAEERFNQGVLWKVEKAGVAPSHLFGTIHVSDPRVTTLPEAVEQAFNHAQSFTMEMVVDQPAELYFAKAMSLKQGQNLRAMLGDDLYTKAISLMQEYGFPPQVTQHLKPWAILITLIVPRPGGEPILDQQLHQKAMLRKKPVHQLESVEEQVAIFDGIPLKAQTSMLESAANHYDELPNLLEQTIQAYLARDLDALWRLNSLYADEGEAGDYEYFIERVLFSRNLRMAQRADEQLRKGGAFVAVGALHLYGEKGVLALLEKQGYRVTRVY